MKSKVISKKAPMSEMPFCRAIIPSRPSNSLLRIISNRANLKNPKIIFTILIAVALCFGYNSKNFRLDASSETLLIEGDPDLKYLQEINKKFGAKEFFDGRHQRPHPLQESDNILEILRTVLNITAVLGLVSNKYDHIGSSHLNLK